MKKTLLISTLILLAIITMGQNDRSKKVKSKYLSLPAYDISKTDPSTVIIEFAMKAGFFGAERLKEGESICKPKGGTIKDAIKVKAFYYEIPYTQQESYVVAKSMDSRIVYSSKTSEISQSVVRFGWDEKMKQAKCEYALSANNLKKDFLKKANSFKISEHRKYENEIYKKAIIEAKANVSLSYIPEQFEVYSAKGKNYNYDDLGEAFDKAMTAYESINKNGFNANDLTKLKEAIAIWEKELQTINTEDKKARITKEIGKGLHENLARAYLYLYDFENAKKHTEAFLAMFGNFSNNRTQAFEQLLIRIHLQKIAADKNLGIIGDVSILNAKASASKSGGQSKLLSSDQFDRLKGEFLIFKGSQASGLMEEKKKEEDALIASGQLNPYQKWYFPTAVGGEGILMNMPPSALSGTPELTELPIEICEFTEAKQLVILKNKITSVPADIAKMKLLVKLDLSGNLLKSLPVEIGQLKDLETLKLNANPLESLPSELANCTKLKTLQIKGTKLSETQIAEIKRMLPNCKIKF